MSTQNLLCLTVTRRASAGPQVQTPLLPGACLEMGQEPPAVGEP